MHLKTSLHLHTQEDFIDGKIIDYNIYELIDYTVKKDFKILALTTHIKFVYDDKYGDYAREKGILLIPSIELNINTTRFGGTHILVLNCTQEAERISDFNELRTYKSNHPECLIIAPHPAFDKLNSITLEELEKNIDIFDAFEHSWFYHKYRNANNKSLSIASKYNKPIIATSDAHFLDFIDVDYSVIDSESMKIQDIFSSIRNGKFQNYTRPKNFLELSITLSKMVLRGFFRKSIR